MPDSSPDPSLPDASLLERFPFVESLQCGLAESDARIRHGKLEDGWQIVNHRGQVIRDAMQEFYRRVVSDVPPRGMIAIHTLGGTGRQEICPGSDVDVGIIVENIVENEHFLRHVSDQLRLLSPMVPGLRSEVKANAFPDLNDGKHFDYKSLVALLDSDLLVGSTSFNDRIHRVCRQRASELGVDFIFAVNQDLRRFDQLHPQLPGEIGEFHVKDGKGGLRDFQLTMWMYSFERWVSSTQVYQQARSTRRFDDEGAPTPEVLDAVGIIFMARCWIEQHRLGQSHRDAPIGTPREYRRSTPPQSLITVDDIDAFLNRFRAEGLTQLTLARTAIDAYRHETLDRLLARGVTVPGADGLVVWGSDGLRIGSEALFRDATELFYSVYAAQQRFGLPIDRSVRRAARKSIASSLGQHPAFIRMMVSKGSIFPAIKDWFEFGVLNRLVPGFDVLSNQLYQPGHRSATLTKAGRAVQRIRGLEYLAALKRSDIESKEEAFFFRQYHDIGPSAFGALRLALLADEIPQTLYDDAPSYAEAVQRYVADRLGEIPGLSGPTLNTIEFLLLKKRELLKWAEAGSDQRVLENWQREISELGSRDTADTIRALALFAFAAFDFHNPKGVTRIRLQPEQWQRIQNLAQNLLYGEIGVTGPSYKDHYFDETGRRIGKLLPRRLLASPHIDNSLIQTYEGTEMLDPQRAHKVIFALTGVVGNGQRKVDLLRETDYYRLLLYAWDFPGLFWRVAGALDELGCSIRSTDLFDIPDPTGRAEDGETLIPGERRLIFDVVTFDSAGQHSEVWEDDVKKRILDRIRSRDIEIPDNTTRILQPVIDQLEPRLTDLGNGQVRFACYCPPDCKGLRYAVSRVFSDRVDANILSIVRDGTRDWPLPRTNFYLRIPMPIEGIADALQNDLGKVPVDSDVMSIERQT